VGVTEEEARQFLGQYCSIEWDGGGMSGIVDSIKDGCLVVDYGYGVELESITDIAIGIRRRSFDDNEIAS